METADLTKLQYEIVQRYNKDGALESILGFCLTVAGWNFLDPPRGGLPIALLPIYMVLLIKAWRKRITYPRLGYTELLAERRARARKTVLISLAVFLILFAIVVWAVISIAGQSPNDPAAKAWLKLCYGLPICAFMAWMGKVRQNTTLYWTSGMLAILFVATAFVRISPGWAFLFTGILLLLFGTIRLIQFLRENPRLDVEAADDRAA